MSEDDVTGREKWWQTLYWGPIRTINRLLCWSRGHRPDEARFCQRCGLPT